MKKILWIVIALIALIVLGVIVINLQAGARLARVYTVPAEVIEIPTDEASIARGKHIFQYRGCEACHGAQLEGKTYLEDPALGTVIAANLTGGAGGVGAIYTDADWIRAIRHGVRPDGTGLLFMPSTEFYFLSDEDLGAVIAYIQNAPPVDHVQPQSNVSLTGKIVMTLVNEITFIPAELIAHDAPRPVAPQIGITPEYGEYLSLSCKVCHGLTMSGGVIPGFPSDWPPAPNLTFGAGSRLPIWGESGFMQTLRTGVTPEGDTIIAKYMPWEAYAFMTDDELKAVWVYLQSLEPLPYGNR